MKKTSVILFFIARIPHILCAMESPCTIISKIKHKSPDEIQLFYQQAPRENRIWLLNWATQRNDPTIAIPLLTPAISNEINEESGDGLTPLMRTISQAQARGDGESGPEKALPIMEKLIELGADPEKKSSALDLSSKDLAETGITDPALLIKIKDIFSRSRSASRATTPISEGSSSLSTLPSSELPSSDIFTIFEEREDSEK